MTTATLLREDLALRMQNEDESEGEYTEDGGEEDGGDDLTADEGGEGDEEAELGDLEEESLPEVK